MRRREPCRPPFPRPTGLFAHGILPGGYLVAGETLIVPVRFAPPEGRGAGIHVAYLFRFSAGRIVSLTEYPSLEDALRGARLTR